MSVELLLDGSAAVMRKGDRFEILADFTTNADRIVRRDYDGTSASLTFDPGDHASLVLRIVGPAETPVRARYLENQLKPLQLVYQRSRRLS